MPIHPARLERTPEGVLYSGAFGDVYHSRDDALGQARTVFLAGNFNNWDPTAKQMTDKKNDGLFTTTISLVPGEYQYKFIINGTWCADPECADWVQNEHGTLNSIRRVE